MPTETPPGSDGVGRFRRRPPVWTALLTAVFAVGVFAATDGVLRLLADPAPATAPGAAPPGRPTATTTQAPGDAPASGATPAPTAPAPGSPPAPGPTPAPGGAGNAPPPGGAAAPATTDGTANESAGEDTNVEEAPEGPRRAAPARPSEDEAPEFRESADNNISLPVDI